jgi:hypothetical protein
VELVDRVDLSTDSGLWVVRSTSPTLYLLDTRLPDRPMMMRVSTPESHSHGWWDGQWAPLTQLVASPQVDGAGVVLPGSEPTSGVLRVGSRHRWTADPGGSGDPRQGWWWSRTTTAIERLDGDELTQLLAEHGMA